MKNNSTLGKKFVLIAFPAVLILLFLSAPVFSCADFDYDGNVAFSDFLLLVKYYGKPVTDENRMLDLDGDSQIGFNELLLLIKLFGKQTDCADNLIGDISLDFNNDKKIDIEDIHVFSDCYMRKRLASSGYGLCNDAAFTKSNLNSNIVSTEVVDDDDLIILIKAWHNPMRVPDSEELPDSYNLNCMPGCFDRLGYLYGIIGMDYRRLRKCAIDPALADITNPNYRFDCKIYDLNNDGNYDIKDESCFLRNLNAKRASTSYCSGREKLNLRIIEVKKVSNSHRVSVKYKLYNSDAKVSYRINDIIDPSAGRYGANYWTSSTLNFMSKNKAYHVIQLSPRIGAEGMQIGREYKLMMTACASTNPEDFNPYGARCKLDASDACICIEEETLFTYIAKNTNN